MDGVVDDVELGVELGRLIFVDLDSFPQQPGIGEARRRDRGIVVRFSGGDDAHAAAALAPGLVETEQPPRRRAEIGGDDVDAPGRAHIMTDGALPGGQTPRRPARSAERRVGTAWVSPVRTRGATTT